MRRCGIDEGMDSWRGEEGEEALRLEAMSRARAKSARAFLVEPSIAWELAIERHLKQVGCYGRNVCDLGLLTSTRQNTPVWIQVRS